MRPFEPKSVLPAFASEQASGAAGEAELAELLAQLSAVSACEASSSEVEQGRARLLATVSLGSERFLALFDKLTKFFDLSAEALRAVFARADQSSQWQPGPLPWVSLFHLEGGPAVAGLDTGLVRLKKGMPFPRHRHVGAERVLILEGSYRDHEHRQYGPGDFHDMAAGTEHALQMSADEDVLLAVILSAEIEIVEAGG